MWRTSFQCLSWMDEGKRGRWWLLRKNDGNGFVCPNCCYAADIAMCLAGAGDAELGAMPIYAHICDCYMPITQFGHTQFSSRHVQTGCSEFIEKKKKNAKGLLQSTLALERGEHCSFALS